MSTSRADASTTAAANSSRQIAWSRRTVCALLATGACVAAYPAATQASSGSPAAAYCSHLPASKVASIVGGKAAFKSAVVVKTTLECDYTAGAAIVALLKEPGLPASSLATLSKAEATALSGFPKGTKVKFSALPALGKTSFSWTATIEGEQFGGVGENKGTTGYGAELSGKPNIPKLERLIALAIAD
jgi:hypothetical protein